MTTRIAITHRIDRSFSRTIRLATHWLRLRPAPESHARISAYSLTLDPEPHFVNWLRDPFENHIARLDLPEPLPYLNLAVEILAELEPKNPFDFLIEPYAAKHPFEYTPQLQKELAPYLALGEPSARVRAFFETIAREPVATVQRISETAQQLLAALPDFSPAAISSRQAAPSLDALLTYGTGSAWDLAWLFTLSLRKLGLAARFTCGYKLRLADEPDHDSVSLHAWTETFVPGVGWLGLDPSSGLFTDETFIPLTSGPDPARAQPLVGSREACEETRSESLRVRRLVPAEPRWPYNETQWNDICALGARVQRDLEEQRVFMSTGMNLSFVAAGSSSPEWHTTALGSEKLRVAQQLLERLLARTAAGAVQHSAQGEWYGGEGLPRWRLIGLARADGHAIWQTPQNLQPTAANALSACDFASALARALGVAPGYVSAAHEDPLHNLWRGHAEVDRLPTPGELDDAQSRRALAERFSQASSAPAGYVLPLAWDHTAGKFRSGAWRFRRPGLHLIPGDSAIGYRLPLDSLIEDKQAALDAQIERSPFDERGELADYHGLARARLAGAIAQPSSRDASPPRTAVCVQARAGQLYVFCPPLSHAEHYLELVAAVQAAAEACELQPLLEGYEPPEDFRLRRFVIEPEPGVLRVELPEAYTFPVQRDLLQTTFDEAQQLGLGMQRLTPEGAVVSSGGGGRLCLGGLRPEYSPFLRRPELLASLIAYFQRHPSLSYLFAGRMIGPSGPAPRPDEGRDAALYELSIALSQVPKGEITALWQGDRMLRHLLSDPAGQIRHAEIRMDQLYAPERDSKRLGRVYIHAFELAPHPQIATLHTLLVHGLIGRFARVADSRELTRWGSALHDRFMLPALLLNDLREVIGDLQAVGYPFQLGWFEPLIALRLPELGQVSIGNISLTLQTALEPWPLLAEEVTAGGVARFIDAANERLQIKLTGLTPGRYTLACNGHGVPLQPTGAHGEFVAGVRYKIANPPSTLHPTIPPAGALVFDLIDTWAGRAVGGCTYLPPRPQLWGAIGVPLSDSHWPNVGDEAAPERVVPMAQTSLAPLGRAGRFLAHGSGLGAMAAPARYGDDKCPYLLDLAHR